MNLLSLRKLIFRALDPSDTGKVDLSEIQDLEYVNQDGDTPWGLLVTVDDGTGTGTERTFRVTVAEAQYAAQVCGKGSAWTTVGTAPTEAEAAELLDHKMQVHGFRYSELHAHRADLAAGHILTADDGYEFRVVLPGREGKSK